MKALQEEETVESVEPKKEESPPAAMAPCPEVVSTVILLAVSLVVVLYLLSPGL